MKRVFAVVVLCTVGSGDLILGEEMLLTVVGDGGTLLQSTDGENWTLGSSGTTFDLTGVHMHDNDLGWCVGYDMGQGGLIRRTTNGGHTWQTVFSPVDRLELKGVEFVDENIGWAVGTPSCIYGTVDGGDTWTRLYNQQNYGFHAVDFVDSEIGWAVGSGATVKHTTDGGLTWAEQTSSNNYIYTDVHFVDDEIGWAVGAGGTGIIHTTNGGQTWDVQHANTSGNKLDVHFVDEYLGWIVGEFGDITHTSNGGVTWNLQYESPDDYTLLDVVFIDELRGWAVGQWGTILHTADGGVTWELQPTGTIQRLNSISIYRKPPPGDFNGDFDIDRDDIDALVGEVVSGAHSVEFDLTGDGLVDNADIDDWLAIAGAANLPTGNPYLYGDANLDDDVDISDFNIWNANKFTATAKWSLGDFDASGGTDVSDFNIWNAHKFRTAAAPRSAPEPSTGLLCLMTLMMIGVARSARLIL